MALEEVIKELVSLASNMEVDQDLDSSAVVVDFLEVLLTLQLHRYRQVAPCMEVNDRISRTCIGIIKDLFSRWWRRKELWRIRRLWTQINLAEILKSKDTNKEFFNKNKLRI